MNITFNIIRVYVDWGVALGDHATHISTSVSFACMSDGTPTVYFAERLDAASPMVEFQYVQFALNESFAKLLSGNYVVHTIAYISSTKYLT